MIGGHRKLEMRADRVGIIYGPFIDIFFIDREANIRIKNIDYEVLKPDEDPGPTPFRIDIKAGQMLMDDLWQCGLRPTEGAGSAGAMRAAERHLADLRTILFKKMDIE